jgi:hypothetical protein
MAEKKKMKINSKDFRFPRAGVLILGDNGFTFDDAHACAQFIQLKDETALLRLREHPTARHIANSLPRTPGHMQEWLAACLTGARAASYSNFELGGPPTEVVFAGVVALRAGEKLPWDGPALRALNAPPAHQHQPHRIKKCMLDD